MDNYFMFKPLKIQDGDKPQKATASERWLIAWLRQFVYVGVAVTLLPILSTNKVNGQTLGEVTARHLVAYSGNNPTNPVHRALGSADVGTIGATAGGGLFTCACTSNNLATNGEMTALDSDGSPSNWIYSTDYPTNATDPTFWASGVHSRRGSITGPMIGNGEFGILNNINDAHNYYISQYQPATPGNVYTLDAWIASHGAANNATNTHIADVYLEFYNGSTFLSRSSKSATTITYSGYLEDMNTIVATAPAGTTRVKIIGHSYGTALKIDGINLTTCYEAPTVTVSPNVTLCPGETATLKATGCIGTLSWNQGITSTSSSVVVNPSVTTTYTVTCKRTNSNCTASDAVTVTRASNPANPVGNNNSRCGTGTVNLSATGCATGGTYNWYSASTGGTLLGTGPSFTTPSISASTNYYVSCASAAGCESGRDVATATIYTKPGAPTATGDDRCGPGTIKLLATGCDAGETYNWYSSSSLSATSVVGTGSIFTTPSLTASKTYYVTCESTSGCESTADAATATINAIPATPTGTNTSRCGPGSVTLTATGCTGTYTWYLADKTTLAHTGIPYVTTITGTRIYYVKCTSSAGCASGVDAVTATVNSLPTATAKATSPTCNSAGTATNNDGKLTLTAFSAGAHYDYTAGSTYTGTDTYTTAAAIPAGGVLVSNLPNPTAAKTYTIRVFTSAGCTDDVTVTLQPTTCTPTCTPSVVTATDKSRCGPGSLTLTASGCATGYTAHWYINSTATTAATGTNTGNIYITPSLTATTNYYVTCVKNTDASCKGVIDKAVATIYAVPGAPVGEGDVLCSPGQAFLSASGCSGTYQWYGSPTSTTVLSSLDTYSPSITSTKTYYVSCELASGCESSRTPVTATLASTPATPTGVDKARCGTGSVVLSATGCTGTYTWYSSPTATTSVGTGSTFTTPSLSSSRNYYVSCESATGCESGRDAATAIINPYPTAPTAPGVTRCGPGSLTLTASGCSGTYKWYNETGTGIHTGIPFVTSVTVDHTYYVTCTSTSGCESTTTAVPIDIVPYPAAPQVTSATRCDAGSVTLTGSGCAGTYQWYNEAGTPFHVGSPYTASVTVDHTYYLTCTINGCESTTAVSTITVNDTPAKPDGNNDDRCGPGTVTLTATGCDAVGQQYKWYTSLTATTPVGTGATFKTPSLAATTTYYVSCSANNCESARDPAIATINTQPGTPTGVSKARCGTGVVSLSATGCSGTYTWYDDPADVGGTPVATGSSFTTPILTATTSYSVSCILSTGCESGVATVIATINDNPTPTAKATTPTCNPSTSSANNDGKVTLSGFETGDRFDFTTGTTYTGSKSYATATAIPVSGVIVSNLANPATTQTYTVRVFNSSGCFADVTVTLTKANCTCTAPTPTGIDNSRCGTGSVTLSATGCVGVGSTYLWYDSSDGSTLVGTGSSFTIQSLTATTTYYVSCSANGCESSLDGATATINPVPSATATATSPTCNLAGTVPNSDGKLRLTQFTSGNRYDYSIGATYTGGKTYATATVVPTGGILVSNLPNPTGNQAYTIRVFNSSDCYKDITVTLIPATCSCTPPLAVGTDNSRCGTGTVTLTATGCTTGFGARWYTDAAGTTTAPGVNIGNTYTTPILTATTNYYVACVNDSDPNCKGVTDVAVAMITAAPSAAAGTTKATCNAAGTDANNDGELTLSNFAAQDRYDYNLGNTYTGSKTYATATAIPTNGVLSSTLPNPVTAQTYTIRIFNANDCYTDLIATLQPTNCTPTCPNPPAVSGSGLCDANGLTYTVTFTISGDVSTVTASAGTVSGNSVTGIPAGTNVVLTANSTNVTCAPSSFTVLAPNCTTPCLIAITATPGVCVSATNEYTVSGTISLTSAIAGTATITDGMSTTTVTIRVGDTSVNYTLAGLLSNGATHTLSVNLPGCGTSAATYTAPVSCSLPPCAMDITATPDVCTPATNQYAVTGTISLTSAIAGTATITDGLVTTTVTISAGTTSIPYTLTGLTANGAQHSIRVNLPGCSASTTTYIAPESCATAPCSIAITAAPGTCEQSTNQYSVTGIINLTNTLGGTATISDGIVTTTVSISAGATSVPYTLAGLTSGGSLHTISVNLPGCGSNTTTYTPPVSCACPTGNCYPTGVSKN